MSLKITHIGHATTLIEWRGVRVLTDPVFSERVLCFKRSTPLKFDPTRLPPLNAVLLSHAHYDHLDLFSYKYIPGDVPIIVPEGMSKAISPHVKNLVIELATWGRYSLTKDFEVCAVPAKHIGGRLLLPYRYATCHGYILSAGGENIYFAGDTAYRSDFKDLKTLFPLKLALLPLSHKHNNWLRALKHMSIDEVIQAWNDLGQPDFIPIHWGVFNIFQDMKRVLAALIEKAEKNEALKSKLHVIEPGETKIF